MDIVILNCLLSVDFVSFMRYSVPVMRFIYVFVCWQVLALGMVFIGVTMTLIAHWPGSTSIGENPLKVAGPVLLAVGLAALIVGIVLVCIVNRRERRRWQKQMAKIIISRSYDLYMYFFYRSYNEKQR